VLKLHHESQEGTSCLGSATIEWSDSLRSWCIFDPTLIIEILRSADFVVTDYAAEYAKLEQRTRMDWTDLIDALNHIPLANEGERHSKLRRDFAQMISARSAAAKKPVGELVAKIVPAVFRAGRSAELVQELIRPINDALFTGLIGTPVPDYASAPSGSQLLDRFLGLNRRKRVQSDITRLSKTFAERNPATSVQYATAMMLVGYDSLLGSLGNSLVAQLGEGAGSRLCDLTYPDWLPRTGVPYVERVAKKDCTIQGSNIHAGDRVRLVLEACPARGQAGEEAPFFSKGRHLCPGKDLSQWLWRTLAQELAKVQLKVRITQARLRPNDYVFSVYESIEVSIYE
jgi:cytochrome P450